MDLQTGVWVNSRKLTIKISNTSNRWHRLKKCPGAYRWERSSANIWFVWLDDEKKCKWQRAVTVVLKSNVTRNLQLQDRLQWYEPEMQCNVILPSCKMVAARLAVKFVAFCNQLFVCSNKRCYRFLHIWSKRFILNGEVSLFSSTQVDKSICSSCSTRVPYRPSEIQRKKMASN